jgi:DNA-binding CsgD family transcriptional regulator
MQQVVLSVFVGINFAFAGLSFSVFMVNRNQILYALFAGFSFFSGLYFLLQVISSVFEVDLRAGIIFCAAVYYGIFPWFLYEFVGKRSKGFLWLQSGIFLLAFLAFLFAPDIRHVPVWQIIAHLGLLGLIVLVLFAADHYKRSGGRDYFAFLMLCGLFVVLSLEEIIRTYSGLPLLKEYQWGIPPLDVYPLLFTISIGIRISNEIILKKELEVQHMRNELSEKNLELTRMEKKQLEDEIEYKKKDLLFFGMELSQKNRFVSSILDRMHSMKNGMKAISTDELDELIKYTRAQLRIDQNMEYFHADIETVNHEFVSRLKKEFPGLTENELHLSSLLRLKLNTKEIASIKNISPDSVKVMRYRLRKKFNLTRNVNLIEFLVAY